MLRRVHADGLARHAEDDAGGFVLRDREPARLAQAAQAGGAARNGDLRRAYITQPSGKRETRSFRNADPDPMPGATVIVPEVDPSSRVSWPTVLAAAAPVLASLVTLVLALK